LELDSSGRSEGNNEAGGTLHSFVLNNSERSVAQELSNSTGWSSCTTDWSEHIML